MRRVKKGLAVVLTLALVTAMMPFSQANVNAAKKMKLSKKKITLTVGSKKKVKVKNAPKGVKVKWKSKNKKIAKVSKKGVITAVKAGKTVVTAKVGTKKLKCKVVVKAKPVSAPQTTKKQATPVATPTTKATEVTQTQNTTSAQATTAQQTTATQSTTKAQQTTAQQTTTAQSTTKAQSTTAAQSTTQAQAGAEDIYANAAFLGDGAQDGALTDVYKAVVISGEDVRPNNIQNFQGITAVHVIMNDALMGDVLVNGTASTGKVEGAGLFININDLTKTDNEVIVKNPDGSQKAVIRIYNKNGNGSAVNPVTQNQTTTKTQPTTKATEITTAASEKLGNVEGLSYAGNENLPHYFAWAKANDVEGYHIFVNGNKITDVTDGCVNLDASIFAAGGKFVIGVQAYKGNLVSDIATIEHQVAAVQTTKEVTTAQATTKEVTTAQATTKAQATTQEQTTAETATLDAVVGFTYAGNEAFPYHFAWATSNNVEGYHVYVNNQKVTDVTLSFVDLDAALFTKNGTYKIGVQAYKGSAVSPINTIDFVVTNGTDNPTQAQQTTQAATQAPTQQPTTQAQPTTQVGGTDIYANAPFLGDGAQGGALSNTYKVVVTQGEASVINIQKPNAITAIYTTYKDPDIKDVSVNGKAFTGEVVGAGIFLNIDDFTEKDNTVIVYNNAGSVKAILRVYNANGNGGVEPTQAPTQAPTQQPTQQPTQTQPTTTVNFTTDSSIREPFGIDVSNPEPGKIRVVWGADEPNCFNVYVDGVRKKTKVAASVQTIPVQTEGNHTVSIAHVNPANQTESNRKDVIIYVNGTAPEDPTEIAEQDKPVIDESIQKQNGKIVLQLNNKTNGQYRDDQIYWIVIGRNPVNHKIAYVDANGNLIEAKLSDNNGKIGDRDYAQKIVHTLADNKAVQLPAIESGRMYLSYGEPVYITFNGTEPNLGYAGPDTNNDHDANYHTLFEYIEFTTEAVNGGITFHGNTTRVDFFSFPMITRLTDEYGGYDRCVGDVGTRTEIFNAFRNEVSEPFQTLITDERIMCPAKLTFGEGKQYGNYYDDYINRFWSYYSSHDLVIDSEAGHFTGRVQGNRIIFNGKYFIDKPTTQDVLEGRGAFNNLSPETRALTVGSPERIDRERCELAIEAQLCAAFTRGIVLDPSKWYKPSTFYPNDEIYNEYAAFFHRHAVGSRAYGFCYDDVADQSTLVECGNAARWTIDLKW